MDRLSQYTDVALISANDLILKYTYLVKKLAYHLKGRLPHSVNVDDLMQAGMMGLLEAWKHFNHEKGASFETYAGIRIRGAMLDEVRRNDWVPRSVHRHAREISNAIKEIEQKTGRDARDDEVAKKIGITLTEYHQWLNQIRGSKIFTFEELGVTEDNLANDAAKRFKEPLDELQSQNFKVALAKNISVLPKKEKIVLSLYYDEELNLKEIGQVIGVSESRVCQIHSQAMIRLKTKMREWR